MDALSIAGRRLVLFTAVGLGLAAGVLLVKSDGPSDAQVPTDESLTKAFAFYASAGDTEDSIVHLGGLKIAGSCREYGPHIDAPYLSVTARTAVDDAMIGVSFTQRNGGQQSAYSFGLSDFDRAYGPWDFLGTNPVNTVGNLVFSRPDGGQVTLTYIADRATAQGECAFSGTVIYAPAVDSERVQASPATVRDELGAPCPIDGAGQFGAGNWRGRVTNISCEAAGRLMYDRLGREFRPTTAESGTHRSAGFRCDWRVLDNEPGWRLECVRADQAIVFDWTP